MPGRHVFRNLVPTTAHLSHLQAAEQRREPDGCGQEALIPYITPSDLTLRHSRARGLMSIPQSGRTRDRWT